MTWRIKPLVQADFTGKTTDDLNEGTTNLYHTAGRVNTALAGIRGAANGIASLDGTTKVPTVELPDAALSKPVSVANDTARDAIPVADRVGVIVKVTSSAAAGSVPASYMWDTGTTSWVLMGVIPAAGGVNVRSDTFTVVTNGQTAFTLSATPGDTDSVELHFNGSSYVNPDFTVVGTTLTWANLFQFNAGETFRVTYI